MRPVDVLHKRVVSGCGEAIGVVVGIDIGRDGSARALRILETGTSPCVRVVEVEHVARVGTDEILLKGPRQGYHIARLTRA